MRLGLNSQIASRAVAITPNDTTKISVSAIYCGGAGNLVVEPEGNVTAGYAASITIAVPAGGYFLCRCIRVLAASTATGIVGLS